MTEHLARLCMDGAGSAGQYTPHAFDLRLLGTDQATDHIVYAHEVHHAGLNDVTAWGSALHVYARLPDAEGLFATLLNACRTVHESLATFASVQIATARHGPLDTALAAYPQYVPLYRSVERLTAQVEGANRRQQIVNVLARLCMQTPIIEAVLAAGLAEFRLADLRERDRPDARWALFLRRGPELLAATARIADQALLAEHGEEALNSDGLESDLYVATDRSHDAAWDYWEAAAYEHLRAALVAAGGITLPINGHQEGTSRLVDVTRQEHGDLGIRAAMTDEQRSSDAELAESVLQQVRIRHSGDLRHRAVTMPSIPVDEMVDLMNGRPVVDDRPAMIVDVRSADRLVDLYEWDPASTPPRVAVRLFVDTDDGEAVGHLGLAQPAELAQLAERWGDRGPFIVCAGASCLADTEFSQQWLTTAPQPVFLLVDIEPGRFARLWAGENRSVVAVGVEVEDTSGRREALLFTADEGKVWWCVVADDVTVRFMIEYLSAHLGSAFRVDPAAFDPIRQQTVAVLTHVLATESFTSFDALRSPRVR